MTAVVKSSPLLLAAAGLAALCLGEPPAWAGIPDPSASTVPARLFLCPAGDSVFVVIPRHLNGDPWAEGAVWVDLCGCSQVRLSLARAQGYTLDAAGCVATEQPPADAIDRFPLAGGGLCPGGSFRVYAGGVLLAIRTVVASPDQNGDLIVDSTDVALARSKLGTADPGADLDGDGIVTEADVALLSAHLGHASPDHQTPALPATWGRIKLLYK